MNPIEILKKKITNKSAEMAKHSCNIRVLFGLVWLVDELNLLVDKLKMN